MKFINDTIHSSVLLVAYLLVAGGLLITAFLTTALFTTAQASNYPAAGNFSEGSKVWAENCNRCHNMRGPKELRDDQWITTTFHMRIRAGLTGQETRDVVTFMQASNTKSVAAGAAQVAAEISTGSTGKETYEKTCVACHGGDGKGAFPGTPNFTSSDGALAKADAELIRNITNGFQSEGSPMAMPPKGGNPNLSDSGIKAVLAYIRATFGQ